MSRKARWLAEWRASAEKPIFYHIVLVKRTVLLLARNCIAEYSRSAGVSPVLTLKKTRLWGTDLSGTPQGAGGVGGLLLITDHSALLTSHSPTYDGNGNISEYLTATGTIAAHFEYDPFGNTVVNTDTADQFNYRFSTKPRDQETGLSYYGYRYYNPTTGRWLNRDPIEEAGGSNLYGFVGNDGVRLVDSLGLLNPGVTQRIAANVIARAPVAAGIAIADGPLPIGDAVAATLLVSMAAGDLLAEFVPEPSGLPPLSQAEKEQIREKVQDRKKEGCQKKYEKYKEAQNKQRDKPIDGAKCCEDAKEIRDLLQEEADGRQDYIDSGCDEIIPNKVQHPTEAANKKAALERAKRKVEELCK